MVPAAGQAVKDTKRPSSAGQRKRKRPVEASAGHAETDGGAKVTAAAAASVTLRCCNPGGLLTGLSMPLRLQCECMLRVFCPAVCASHAPVRDPICPGSHCPVLAWRALQAAKLETCSV